MTRTYRTGSLVLALAAIAAFGAADHARPIDTRLDVAHQAAAGQPLGGPSRRLADLWTGSRPVHKTVEGNLIDLNCYVEHAGVGERHTRCARICAQQGMPLALLDTAGRLYLVSGPGHVDPRTLNAPLLDLLERTVHVTGLFFEHEDVKLVAIERAVPAVRQAPLEDVLRRYRGPLQ
jgi:hypothetical protein